MKDDYRGHAIQITSSNSSPFTVSYIIWKIGPTNNYRAYQSDTLSQFFEKYEDTSMTAIQEAKQKIDEMLINNDLNLPD